MGLVPGSGSPVQRPVLLRLVKTPREAAAPGIAQVTLHQHDSCLSAKTSADGSGIEVCSPFQPPRTQPMRGRPDAELLVAALGVGGRDPLMYEALRLGSALLLGDVMLQAQEQSEVRW